MSRGVISYYSHEENLCCAGEEAVVVREIARSLSRKHEVVVISSFFPGCYRERPEPFQRIFLPTNRVGPLAGIVRRIRHDLWIESMPSVPPPV